MKIQQLGLRKGEKCSSLEETLKESTIVIKQLGDKGDRQYEFINARSYQTNPYSFLSNDCVPGRQKKFQRSHLCVSVKHLIQCHIRNN